MEHRTVAFHRKIIHWGVHWKSVMTTMGLYIREKRPTTLSGTAPPNAMYVPAIAVLHLIFGQLSFLLVKANFRALNILNSVAN